MCAASPRASWQGGLKSQPPLHPPLSTRDQHQAGSRDEQRFRRCTTTNEGRVLGCAQWPGMARSGSGRRQRQKTLSARFNEQEATAIRELADRAGTSVAFLIRERLLGGPQPRATRRPTINHEAVARLLGELGRIAEALRAASAAGSEHEYRALVAAALRDLAEMRVVCFEALGRSP